MRSLRIFMLVACALTILGAFVYTSAQEQDTTCPALIDQALNAIGSNCNSLDRNSACYGFQQVSATFTQPTTSNFFSQPSDRAQLALLERIGTSAMDLALKKWGIALMSVQADLPDSLPGQNTVFMLLGDTEVENAVKPGNEAGTGTVIQVTTRAEAPMYAGAQEAESTVATIPANVILPADALSPTGEWVRVVYQQQPGWVDRDTLVAQDAINTLRILNPDAQSPMQSVYLRTSITGTHCTQAPDSLVVQGPQHLKVNINVNGADIRLGSTIALRILPLSPELADQFRPLYPDIDQVTRIMELVVIDGHATLDADTPQEVNVDAGYRTYRCLSEPENLGLDQIENDRQVIPPCPWLAPQQWRQVDYDNYNVFEGVPLNYPISLPQFPAPTLTPTASNTPTRTPTRTPVPFRPSRTPSRTPTALPTCLPPDFDGSVTGDPVFCTSTPTYTPSLTPTFTLTPSDTPTPTATPLLSDTPSSTPTASDTPLPTATPTDTPLPTATDTPLPTATDTPLPTATDTPLPTATDTPLPTATDTPLPTATDTPPPTATNTPLPTATDTPPPIP